MVKKEPVPDSTAMSKMMASHDYEPTEEDKAYKGWKHFIPFRPASKYVVLTNY